MAVKSPAFQFYPNDYIGDEGQSLMSLPETGAYIRLLCRCWVNGSLPDDVPALAVLCGATPNQMSKFWPAISKCFKQREDGRWIHARLEKERKKQADYRQRQTDTAFKRWPRPGNAMALPTHSQQPSLGNALISSYLVSSQTTSIKDSPEPLRDSSPAVVVFPVIGDPKAPEWALTEARIAEWRTAFPGVDIEAECRRALVWVNANQRKTAKGMPKFLVSWLGRAVDRPRGFPKPAPTADPLEAQYAATAQRYGNLKFGQEPG